MSKLDKTLIDQGVISFDSIGQDFDPERHEALMSEASDKGENIILKAAFKPTGTIIQNQNTVTDSGKEIEFGGRGRHDPCVLPRAVPMVESMVAIVLLDHSLRHNAQNNFLD